MQRKKKTSIVKLTSVAIATQETSCCVCSTTRRHQSLLPLLKPAFRLNNDARPPFVFAVWRPGCDRLVYDHDQGPEPRPGCFGRRHAGWLFTLVCRAWRVKKWNSNIAPFWSDPVHNKSTRKLRRRNSEEDQTCRHGDEDHLLPCLWQTFRESFTPPFFSFFNPPQRKG